MITNRDYIFRGPNNAFQALWCVDSETSREYLINLHTNEIIAERVDGKIVNPPEVPPNAAS